MTISATTIPIARGAVATEQPILKRLSSRWHDVVVFSRRNLVHIRREPLQLSDVTIQPVLFTMLFIYVFGAGIPIKGGSYKDFVLAGLLSLNLVTSAMGTGVGISSDMATGAINRFRSLPIWRPAVLIGRSVSDVLAAALCVTIVAATGLVVGWRPGNVSIPSVIGGFAIALLFSYAIQWACACIGLVSKGPESAQGMGLIILFPLAFVSNAMVPTQGMPAWLADVANWNPVSALTAAARTLLGNPNPEASVHAWPMEHPVVAAIAWSLVLLAIFVPLATYLFKRRTTE
ncbi:MAG: ABC transporter permease [Acidimicrobiales bacterium]|jgi:ABC-2 type transport system permease protein